MSAQQDTDEPVFISLDQAAARLSMSRTSIQRLISDGRLPIYRITSRMVRVKRSDVDAVPEQMPTVGYYV